MYYAWPYVMGVNSTVILLPYIVGVTTPILREETLDTVCCGCNHIHTPERKPYILYVVGCDHTHTSERKPYISYGLACPYYMERNLYMPCAMG